MKVTWQAVDSRDHGKQTFVSTALQGTDTVIAAPTRGLGPNIKIKALCLERMSSGFKQMQQYHDIHRKY